LTSILSSIILPDALQVGQRAYQNSVQNEVNRENPHYTRVKSTSQTTFIDGHISGVRYGKNIRQNHPVLYENLLSVKTNLEKIRSLSHFSEQLETALGEVSAEGHNLSKSVSDFFNTFALPIMADHTAYLKDTVDKAEALAAHFRELSVNIQNLRANVDYELSSGFQRVNDLLNRYHTLNVESTRGESDSARRFAAEDDKEAVLIELATYMTVKESKAPHTDSTKDALNYLWGPDGLALSTQVRANRFDFTHHPLIHATDTLEGGQLSGATLCFDELSIDATPHLKEGQLGALFALRDTILPQMQEALDRGASVFADHINAIHTQGSAYDTPSELQSAQSVDGTVSLVGKSGVLRVAVVDEKGVVVEKSDLLLQTFQNVDELLTSLNQMDNLQVRLQGGTLQLTAEPGTNGEKQGVALCGLTPDAKDLLGSWHLNDLFTSESVHIPFDNKIPHGFAETFKVREEILHNPARIAHGKLNTKPHLCVGESGVGRSDFSTVQAIGNASSDALRFEKAGFMDTKSMRFFDFSRTFMNQISSESARYKGLLESKETAVGTLQEALDKAKGVDPAENRLEQMKWASYLQDIMALIGMDNALHQRFLDTMMRL